MPTNQEWLHKLANESPDELKAWFDAEHNDNLAAEKVVSGDAAHSKDGNAHLKDSEDLSDGFTDSRENLGSEPSTSEVFGGKGSEVDSREKLEADVRQILYSAYMLAWTHGHENRRGNSFEKLHGEFYNLLDRQAAITANANKELIEWQAATVARLQKEVDRLQRRNDELRTSYDKLKRERDSLADDLLTCNREREQLRKHLGIALDHAHDICSLVDIDGNVLDVGD